MADLQDVALIVYSIALREAKSDHHVQQGICHPSGQAYMSYHSLLLLLVLVFSFGS